MARLKTRLKAFTQSESRTDTERREHPMAILDEGTDKSACEHAQADADRHRQAHQIDILLDNGVARPTCPVQSCSVLYFTG